jgi:hypothetical protein
MTPLRENSGFPEQQRPTGSTAAPPLTVRAMPASHPEQVFFHFDFLRSLQLHGKLAIGIFALALTLATAYVLRMWPIYEAQSLVYIQPAPLHLMDRGASNSWPFDSNTYESYIQQQIHSVTRSDVLLGALHKLPVTAWRQSAESEQAAADRLGRAVEVTRVGTGYQVSITARTSDATLAAQISNAVASSFIESATRELRSGDAQRLNSQLAQLTAAGGATPRLQRSNELAADIQRLQSRFSAVDEQYRTLTMENNAPGAVYLSAAAVPPLHASHSGVLRNALVLAFAGLLLGIVAALTAHNLDPHMVPASSTVASTAPSDALFRAEEAPRLTPRPLRREPSHRGQNPSSAAGQESKRAAPPRYGTPATPGRAAAPGPPSPTAPASARAYRSPEPPRDSVANAPQAPNLQPGGTLDTDADDIPYSAASRLGGLRNLFTALGLRGLDKDTGFGSAEPETASRSQRQPERPVYAEAYTAPPADSSDPTNPSIAAVTASPEFLPLRAPEITEKEKEPPRPANPAPVQRDPEELQTLPSWRGQYRRRR